MAALLYTRLKATVTRLIATYGADAVWSIIAVPTPDPAKPWEASAPQPPPTAKTIKVCVVDGKGVPAWLSMIKGIEVPTGGKVALFAPTDFEPKLTDSLLVSGTDLYTINTIKTVNPGGVVLLYKVDLTAVS